MFYPVWPLLEIVRSDYSEIAEYYDRVRMESPDTRGWLDSLMNGLKDVLSGGGRILDVGCGTGRFAIPVLEAGVASVTAIDYHREMIEKAREKPDSEGVAWLAADGERLPFVDASFDAVFLVMSMHHFKNKTAALDEIYRVLAPGGVCLILTTSHSQIKAHDIRFFPKLVAIDLARFPTIPGLKEMLKDVGFSAQRHGIIRGVERRVETKEIVEKFESRYISTLTEISEDEFRKGMETFKTGIRKAYGKGIRRRKHFFLVRARKP